MLRQALPLKWAISFVRLDVDLRRTGPPVIDDALLHGAQSAPEWRERALLNDDPASRPGRGSLETIH